MVASQDTAESFLMPSPEKLVPCFFFPAYLEGSYLKTQ